MSTENTLIARICHDLITPFNAINLGLEAFEMSSDMFLIEDIKKSTAKANVTLKFIRELFSEKSDGFCYSVDSLKYVVADMLSVCGISYALESDIGNIPNVAGKIIMFTAIVAKEIMPFGGTATTNLSNMSGRIITCCSGKSVAIPSMVIHELSHGNIMRHYLIKLLHKSGFEMTSHKEGTSVVICQKMI
ncbi:MAG: hypothetical protein LBT70_00765 [Holosporaceae bacterium]|jgi:hypothetical protein|nr:hypothetical protein [Holosporaceae bacterium]